MNRYVMSYKTVDQFGEMEVIYRYIAGILNSTGLGFENVTSGRHNATLGARDSASQISRTRRARVTRKCNFRRRYRGLASGGPAVHLTPRPDVGLVRRRTTSDRSGRVLPPVAHQPVASAAVASLRSITGICTV